MKVLAFLLQKLHCVDLWKCVRTKSCGVLACAGRGAVTLVVDGDRDVTLG